LFVRLLAVAMCMPAASLALRAQRGGGGAPAAPPPVPVAASSLAAHPLTYVGRTVTMIGTVAQQLSPTIFTINQGQAAELPVPILVVAPTLTAPPPPNAYVSVVGAAVLFDPSDLSKLKNYSLDISKDVAAKFNGRPAVFATSVVAPNLTDLAKVKPAPMSPEEVAFSNLMKQVQPASTALRTGVTASDAAAAHARAEELKKLFTDVQAFFKKRGIAEAEGWAGEMVKFADTVDTSAGAGKWPEATTAATSLNGMCTTCHTAYRERLDDGTYRLKASK
jgi:hypothetical protein